MPNVKKGYYITDVKNADPSVGLYPQTWVLIGEFDFGDDFAERDFFEALQSAFEIVTGEVVEITNFGTDPDPLDDADDPRTHGQNNGI